MSGIKEYIVLYVEDDLVSRSQIQKTLERNFKNIYAAKNGLEGLKLFKQKRPQIVISDIHMPNMDGFEMLEKIKEIDSTVKVIIMTASDEKEHLLKSINLGVMHYLIKPVSSDELLQTVLQTIETIENEEAQILFNQHLKSVLNYRSNLILLLKDGIPVIANQIFLDFFRVDTISDFSSNYGDIGNRFMPHEKFLFNTEESDWFKTVHANSKKLYHVKMEDLGSNVRHFLLKYQRVLDREGFGIVSLDDITELNLFEFFHEEMDDGRDIVEDNNGIFKLTSLLQKQSAEIKMHSYYKGLSITNSGTIIDASEDAIVIKTNYTQQRAIKKENILILSSEILPHFVLCNKVEHVNFENQTIRVSDIHFINSSPTQRRSVRVEPDSKHALTLIFNKLEFSGRVVDISVKSAKIAIGMLPSGLKIGDTVQLNFIFHLANKTVKIDLEATVFRFENIAGRSSVVFAIKSDSEAERLITSYVLKRQLELIHEFKGIR